MSDFTQNLRDSAREIKRVRVLVCCAVCAALGVVLELGSIRVTPELHIGFSTIPNQIVDTLFGPVTGALYAGVLDILKYIVAPSGAFHPGFTFDAMLAAFIYGCFYYRRPVRFWRVLAAQFLVALVVNVGLATFWLSTLQGKAFFLMLPARALKNLVQWPINSSIFYFIAKEMEQDGIFRLVKR